MTHVLILIAALHGYHGTQKQCSDITDALIYIDVQEAIDSHTDRSNKHRFGQDLDAIRKFSADCQKPQKRSK